MPAPFPVPSENMTGILSLISYANDLTGGFIGTGILIVLAIISFLSAKAFSSTMAFGFSAFLTLIVAILFRFMGLIEDNVLYFVVVAFIGVMIWIFSMREQETT